MLSYKEPVQEAPCKSACPAGVDVSRYVRLIGEGEFDDALAVVREKLPFPSVCGRVCFHPCEDKCNGNHLGGPIAICALKRFVAERPGAVVKEPPSAKSTGKRVAVIGSGPAGLTAAYYFAKLGHAVTVFEALPEPGGMMRFGIPDYRLPKDILVTEINAIKNAGVSIQTNSKIESPAELLRQGYDGVFVAIGAHKGVSMGVEGEDVAAVKGALSLMKGLNSGSKLGLGDNVVVVGGGNAAVDTARCALRLGSKRVSILYRRSREEMLANSAEVEQALAEGVDIQFLTMPIKILMTKGKAKVDCVRTKLGELDAGGRRQAEPISGSEFTMLVDAVVSAIGRVPDLSADSGLATTDGGLIQADANTLATNETGIFAGGDAVTGPASVIEAIAAGRQAAVSIDQYLGGKGEIDVPLAPPEAEVMQTGLQGFPVGDRAEMPSLRIDERLRDFSPVELGFSDEQAIDEANRCLRCDLPITIDVENCTGCLTCVLRCSLRFEDAFSPAAAKLKVIPLTDQINEITFLDGCDTCGICARHCPHDALYRGVARPVPVVMGR